MLSDNGEYFYKEILAEKLTYKQWNVTVSKLHYTKYSFVLLCLGVLRHPWAVL